MKTSTAIAFTVAALVSFVTAADQPNSVEMGAKMTTDLDQAMPMTSDQAKSSGLRGHRSPSLFIPVGVVGNKVTATGNNVVVSKSNIVVNKSDRVALAGKIDESDDSEDEPTTNAEADTSTMMKGPGAPSIVVPVGVVSNKLTATGNNVLVTKSNIVISKNDRVQLAKIVKEMTVNDPVDVSAMTTQDLVNLLMRLTAGTSTPAKSNNTGASPTQVLLGVALPVVGPAATSTVAPPAAPAAASTMTTST